MMRYPRCAALPSRKWHAILLIAGGTVMLAAACATSTSNQEPAGPDRVERPLWAPVATDMLGAADPSRRLESRNYVTLNLDREKLATLLARTPREHPGEVSKSEIEMDFPWPDGSFKRLRIEEASIKEPGLAVRCPDLKIYRGRVDGSLVSARFEWSPSGFRAVATGQEEVHVVPYSPRDARHYIAHFARDWRPGIQAQGSPAPGQGALSSPPAISAAPAPYSGASIDEIAIQRLCFACENQYELTLRRSGPATLRVVGVLGTDHSCSGKVTGEDFARIAGVIQKAGFFDLDERYRNPQLADGDVLRTTVVLGTWRKTVSHRDDAGPPSLKLVEDSIHALGEKISWSGGHK